MTKPASTPDLADLEFSLTEQDLIDQLEDIAVNGSATARIGAVKELRRIRGLEDAPAQPPETGFDDLD